MKTTTTIEPLESRIAPAAVFVTYNDLDGDLVRISASNAGLIAPPLDLSDLTLSAGASGHLTTLNLTEAGFDTASIVFTVTKAATGDGLADVRRINAGTNDLATVLVRGDLAEIDAGSGTDGTPAIASLSVRSMGLYGNGGDSDILGALGSLKVTRDLKDAYVHVFGGTFAMIGPVTIGGSLVGGVSGDSGKISATGAIGAVRIGGDVQGGAGVGSGHITASGNIQSVTVGGSLIGGSAANAGSIFSFGNLGPVRIGGDIDGGSGGSTGFLFIAGTTGTVNVGGSILGGSASNSGQILSAGALGFVTIGHDVVGSAGTGSGSIEGGAKMAGVTIGGSLLGGAGNASGRIANDGTPGAPAADIGPVKIGGDVQGGSGNRTGRIGSHGKLASVTLGGSLIGGSNIVGSGEIKSAGDMGPVTIGGDVQGGSGPNSGRIFTLSGNFAKLGNVTVAGSILGGDGADSGQIASGFTTGVVRIGGDIVGGAGAGSGRIDSAAFMVSVSVGGSLAGGGGAGSGSISSGGDLLFVTIGRNVLGGTALDTGLIFCNDDLGPVTVGGSVVGGAGVSSGAIIAAEKLGAVKIGRDLRGGAGEDSGRVVSNTADIASVSVGGSLVGGSAVSSGGIGSLGPLGPVKIGRNVVGGSASNAGAILTFDTLASLTVGGSLVGGTAIRTGYVGSVGDMGPVKIGGNIVGGSIPSGAPTLDRTGFIEADRIASVTVGGSMIAGINEDLFNDLTNNASIRVADDLGPVVVRGSLIGRKTVNSFTPVIISARGQELLAPGATSDVAIRSLTVVGRVEWSLVLAGFDQNDPITAGTNGNASIGIVNVGGDWLASSITAGVQDPSNSGFGKATDQLIPGATLISRIASITIAGTVAGDVRPEDHFGFVARQIGFFRAGAFLPTLTAAQDAPIQLSRFTGDVTIREV